MPLSPVPRQQLEAGQVGDVTLMGSWTPGTRASCPAPVTWIGDGIRTWKRMGSLAWVSVSCWKDYRKQNTSVSL